MTHERTRTASTLLGAMHELRVGSIDETPLWQRLEAEVLTIIDQCDTGALITSLPTYLAGSEAVLRALPARPAFKRIFGQEDERRLRLTLPVEVFGAAIEQRYLRPGQTDRMLAHRPGDATWTRYLCEILSPLEIFRHNGMCSPWARLSLPEPIDYNRIEAVIAAQLRDHPDHMKTEVGHCLCDRTGNFNAAAALLICGVPMPEKFSFTGPEGRALGERAASHHGMLSIHAEYGPLPRAIRNIVEIEDPESSNIK